MIERLEAFTLDESVGHWMRVGFNPPGPHRVEFSNIDDDREAIYSTAIHGTVVVRSDGTELTVDYSQRVRRNFPIP